MPRVYKRKTSRATTYTEESLRQAIEAVESKQLGVRAASRDYGIPLRTLVRRIQAVIGPLAPHSHLGTDAETKLVDHIKKLQQRGFAPSRRDVQEMAFCLAEKLGVKHRFNTELERAGTHWFLSFMKRHKDLSIRMAEGVSVYRAKGMNREDVGNYFKQLEKLLTEYNLFNKPGHLFNMDESGLQLNNKFLLLRAREMCISLLPQRKARLLLSLHAVMQRGIFSRRTVFSKARTKNRSLKTVCHLDQKLLCHLSRLT